MPGGSAGGPVGRPASSGSGLPRPSTFARGGKPIPNSRTRTRAQRAVTKWPSSWISTSAPRMTMNRTIVIADCAIADHADDAPDGPAREGGADLGVERDERVDVGRLVAALAEPLDRGLEQARDAREVERPVEEPGDGHLVGGDQGRGRAAPGPAGVARDAQGREARLVGLAEVQAGHGDQVGRRRR